MRILALQLRNFQAHKRLDLEFDRGITTIKGPTDCGKTAILRALRWITQNNIAGSEFIREGQTEAEVVLTVEDGKGKEWRITRARGRHNQYLLEDREYAAFGSSVPPDIAALLRIADLNFQAQHDPPFWFSETAGEVSRQLNAVIDLSVIDEALSNVAAELRKAQERKNLCEERLADAEFELRKLEPERERIRQFAILKNKYEAYTTRQADSDTLAAIMEEARANRSKTYREWAEEGRAVLALFETAFKADQRFLKLRHWITGIEAEQQRAEQPPDFSRVETAFNRWNAAAKQEERLSILVQDVADADNQVYLRSSAKEKAEQKFHAETVGRRCPLCGTIIRK